MSAKTVEEYDAEIKEIKNLNPNYMTNDRILGYLAELLKEKDRISRPTQGN